MGSDFNVLVASLRAVMQFLGALILISGLMLCFAPGLIKKLNDLGKRLLFNDEGVLKHNLKIGILFIVLGIIILYINICFAPR
ncbi:MAG: hypothetical protein NC818_07030 [Candidatus Omnitrophica bacterium]|nr:hypothetical protein [Candidatus Omnitrophota bacterium]